MCDIEIGVRKEGEQKLGTIVETLAQWKLWVSPRQTTIMCRRKKQLCVEINILCFKLPPAKGELVALQVSYPVPAQWSKCTLVKMHIMILMITDSHNAFGSQCSPVDRMNPVLKRT